MIKSTLFVVSAGALVLVSVLGLSFSNKAAAQLPGTVLVAQHKEIEDDEKPMKSGPMTAPVAKITPVAAMAAAEKKVGGKAAMAMFEFDEGHWVYGVIVAKSGKLMEVDVDPVTGKAGATEAVTPDDEAKEFKAVLTKLTKPSSK